MFTGIVEGTGTVRSLVRRGDVTAIRIDVGGLFEGLALGGSVAINGCCLTAVRSDAQGFDVDLTEETLRRTRFDGHVVQGHVDGVGRVLELRSLGESAEIRIEAPPELERYLVEKGSLSVDGISLTVYGIVGGAFSVALIPYTLQVTNLRDARPGSLVNLEVDVIAKYVERLLAARGL